MAETTPMLRRELGVFGAVMMGLGSIIGTGVFVSIGIAAGVAGPAVILSLAIAALVAICNGLNSAQLAANHAVSGGTYEYGYKFLNPWFGFTAGWVFLLAKSASAATAALGFAGYLLNLLGVQSGAYLVLLAFGAVIALTLIVLAGIRRSNTVNIIIVSITLATLTFFVIAGLPLLLSEGTQNLTPFFGNSPSGEDSPVTAILYASALMFVAYTGYGRIATMGEEVRDPRQTIPRAIIVTMIVTMILYSSVAVVAIGSVGADTLYTATESQAAPLEVAAREFEVPFSSEILAVGAITAMLGVLLNLILGLSRVLLAMGRRADMPRIVSRLDASGTTPYIAVILVGAAIAGLTLIGSVRTTWSFSAFTVLVYYAITNYAALKLNKDQRLFPAWIGWIGLAACLFLAFWVEPQIWIVGLILIFAGILWRLVAQRLLANGS